MNSNTGHFCRNIIYNDETRVNFLKSKKLLPEDKENNLKILKIIIIICEFINYTSDYTNKYKYNV